MKRFASDDEIGRIGRGLIDCTLAKSQWTHAGHFAASLWILARRPDIVAARDIPRLIRSYNNSTGVANTDTGGYHETITQASLRAARAFLAAAPPAPLFEICNQLMGTSLGRPDWLLEYWRRDTLFSVEARRIYVNPDLQQLPF